MHLDVPNSKQQLCFLTTPSPRIRQIPLVRYSTSTRFEKRKEYICTWTFLTLSNSYVFQLHNLYTFIEINLWKFGHYSPIWKKSPFTNIQFKKNQNSNVLFCFLPMDGTQLIWLPWFLSKNVVCMPILMQNIYNSKQQLVFY